MMPKRPPRLLIAADDAGGGAALAPVIRALLAGAAPAAEVRLAAAGPSLTAWRQAGWAVDELSLPLPPALDLLPTATSCNERQWEPRLWAAARARAVPSLALLDFWSNYRARAESAPGKPIHGQPVWPDHFAVMDAAAAEALAAAGCPAGRIVITGQPALDALLALPAQASPPPGDAPRILFVSQPLTEMAALTGQPAPADEFAVLGEVLAALALPPAAGPAPQLVVRPHPREPAGKYENWLASHGISRVSVDRESPARSLIAGADLVIGMHSILLLEASCLGCAVLSLQPGALPAGDPLPSNRWGMSRVCYTLPAARQALAELLSAPDAAASRAALRERCRAQRRHAPPPEATAQVVALVARIIANKFDKEHENGTLIA